MITSNEVTSQTTSTKHPRKTVKDSKTDLLLEIGTWVLAVLMLLYLVPNIIGAKIIVFDAHYFKVMPKSHVFLQSIYNFSESIRPVIGGILLPLIGFLALPSSNYSRSKYSIYFALIMVAIFAVTSFSIQVIYAMAKSNAEQIDLELANTIELSIKQYGQDAITFIGIALGGIIKTKLDK